MDINYTVLNIIIVVWFIAAFYDFYTTRKWQKWQKQAEEDLELALDELDELVDEYRVEIVRQKMQELYAPPERKEATTVSNEIDRELAHSLSRTKINCEWEVCKYNKNGACQNDSVELVMDNEEDENLSCTKFDYGDVMG